MSTDISVAGHAMTPAMKAIPTHPPTNGHNGSGNGAPVADATAIAPAAEPAPAASPWTPADDRE